MYLYNNSILLLSLNLDTQNLVTVPASYARDPGSNSARSRSSSTDYTYQVNWFRILGILTAKHL